MRFLAKAADAIDRCVIAIGRASTWLALPLAAVIIFDVITRRFGGIRTPNPVQGGRTDR